MSLSPDAQDIFGSYEFCEEERRHLIDYFTECKKQMAYQIDNPGEANWDETIRLHKELSEDGKSLTSELSDYCTAWSYSDQDWVDLCEDLIKELKK